MEKLLIGEEEQTASCWGCLVCASCLWCASCLACAVPVLGGAATAAVAGETGGPATGAGASMSVASYR